MEPDDHPSRLEFVLWFLQQTNEDIQFPDIVLFTDESQFTRQGISNYTTCTNRHDYQRRFAVNIWADIIGVYLLGPSYVASSTQVTNVQNVLGRSPPEIIGGSIFRDQKENMVST